MKQTDSLQKRYALYCRIFTVGLMAIFVTFLPYLADYYLLQPPTTIFDFYAQNTIDEYYIFETIIVILTVAAIWCISGRLGIAICILSVFFLLLSYASSIKYAAINDLFRLSDLQLTEAAGIAMRYLNLKFTPAQLMVIILILLQCVGGLASDRFCFKYPLIKKHSDKCRKALYIIRVFLALVCLTVMFFYGESFFKNTYSMEYLDNSTVSGTENNKYILYNFLKNDKFGNIDMTHVENSYRFFLDNSDSDDEYTGNQQFPNVIVIMNESWWNTDYIPDNVIAFSSDPMEPFHRLAMNCSSGELSANIFCGDTIGSEAEFLTGLNIKYFTSFGKIATEIREHKIPTIVDYFNTLDYDTIAIHPYDGSFYDRDKFYQSIGFDKIIFEEDMSYTDIYSRYISDESLVNQIIKEYEENNDINKFIFAVSIANHIRWLESKNDFNENYPYPISITLSEELDENAYINLVNYINGIYLANEAFAKLVSYFEQKNEPTLLVMYGDHMPGFSEEALTLFNLDGDDLDSIRRQYAVPVLMWSNFETKQIVFEGENISYLPQMMLEYAHLPESDMSRILKKQRETLRTNTRYAIDCFGQPVEFYNEIQMETIGHFKVVDYDILYGSSSFRDRIWQPYD